MNLYQLRYFITLGKLEHYTRAAEVLNTTQPNLTHAIKSLEAELHVHLFERDGRNVVLTRYGREFLIEAESILERLDIAVSRLQAIGEGSECLEIGCLRTIGTDYLPAKLKAFKENYPNSIDFHYHDGYSSRLIKMLEEKTCDLIFCSKGTSSLPVNWYPILEREYFLIVPEDHELADKDEITLQEITSYPFLAFHPSSGIRHSIDQLFTQAGIIPNTVMELEEDQVIAGFVAHHFGISIVPDMPILSMLPLRKIPIRDCPLRQTFYMGVRADCEPTPAQKALIRFITRKTDS